ncbi:MAG TPA: TIGR00282 family metallophosphoesterase [Dictyoglomaceae bacterium]|nr:TIGR00282 family metallophosphoesterase [Dictyoglomaceae bacterium]HOL39724.1 TIGR00282 family metallophosphoesterase [Dictyoglomaceae bacterium]HOP95462.1 TIGR00282 family metallophosphoesterase [Dictyoglomaceae bacterium]HPP16143.1 TIGR00282 family metallophosphoesterase [Dictyoglomaceae bacterium]HPU43910.1 TIGR00282 family metallophosphoesterase [Dictyoglomaceae bacterium]
MNILILGDIVGRIGRRGVGELLSKIKEEYNIDFVIANIENAASGFGITENVFNELIGYGIDAFTSGNHIWDKKEGLLVLDSYERITRPANYPKGVPGRGYIILSHFGKKIGIINIQGRVFMEPIESPFAVVENIVEEIEKETKIIIVDIHAEATSEKIAMGYFLDGKVTAVVGTHTHVQTADERILSNGTAYITDLGMCGSYDSVLGVNKETILRKFLLQIPQKFDIPEKGLFKMEGVIIEVDEETGRTKNIKRLQRRGEI